MHDYLFGIEAVRFAFVFGVVMSMFVYERRHVTTGSIVVPGYIAVFVLHPLVLLSTFLNALVSYWFVNRLLPRYVLLYGRTKFSVLVLTSIAIQAIMLELSPSTPYLWESDVPLLVGAGYVIPALIAHDVGRQGMRTTVKAVLSSGVLVSVPILVALLFVPGVQADRPLVDFAALSFPPAWVPVAVLVGALTAWALQENHGLRSGGFIGAAYLAMLSATWWQVAFLIGIAVITWLLVTRLLMRFVILFGRRKFSTMLLLGALLSWGTLSLAVGAFGLEDQAFTTLASVALTPLFLPGLLANDMERTSPGRVVIGAGLGATFVFAAVGWLSALTSHGSPTTVWLSGVVAVVTGVVVFDRQIMRILGSIPGVPASAAAPGGPEGSRAHPGGEEETVDPAEHERVLVDADQ